MANSIVFDVLIDTAFLLFDGACFPQCNILIDASFALEIPRDSRTPNADLFQHVANVDMDDLPQDMPGVNRRRIASLLAYVSDDAYVDHLVYASRNASGDIVFGPDVQNNPWEWTESIEPSVSSTSTLTREKPELKNSSSIPLEVFGTRPTGERVFGEVGGRDQAAVRQLEDGLVADNVFERDWRETRMDLMWDVVAGGECGGEGGHDGGGSSGGAAVGVGGGVEHIKQEPGGHAQISSAPNSGSGSGSGGGGGGAGGGGLGGGGSSPAATVRSQRSSVASSSRPIHRAGSVLSTSSRGRSSGHGGGGGGGDGDHSVSSDATGTRGSSKRKASNSSLDLDASGSSSTRGGAGSGSGAGGRRGRARGSGVSGRGKGKKK